MYERSSAVWRSFLPGLVIGLTVFFGCAGESGETRTCLPIEVRNRAGNYFVPGVWGDIVYRTVDGRELSLDAYVQPGPEKRPGVIVVHGGRWASGSRITYVGQLLEMLTEAGFNWFSIDYRLAPGHGFEDAVDDVRAALDFVRCNADGFRTDPERMALLGEDSGAHLAALAVADSQTSVQALVTLGGPFFLEELKEWLEGPSLDAFVREGIEESVDTQLVLASPAWQVPPDMPPVLAVHGTRDKDVPPEQSQRFCEIVRDQGGVCDFLAVEGAIHAPENWTPAQWGYKGEIVRWMSRVLEPRPLPVEAYQDARLQKNIVFGRFRDSEGGLSDLLLDAWIPEGDGPFPAVVLAHGGGWEAGDKVTYLTPILGPLTEAGIAWFSIDYRLTPQYSHHDQLDDLRRAIRFVRHHSQEFRVDPDRVAVLGESASGQMAVQMASQPCPGDPAAVDPVDREPCEVRAVVSFYGVYDFLPMVQDASPRSLLVRLFGMNTLDDRARQLLRDFSPVYQVHDSMPPLLLIHGTDEFLWEQALQLQARLEEVGADYELVALEGAPHGMENWEGHSEWAHYKTRLVDWLKVQLGP